MGKIIRNGVEYAAGARPIQVNSVEILGNNTIPLNLIGTNHIQVANSNGTVAIGADLPDVYKMTYDSTTESIKFTSL